MKAEKLATEKGSRGKMIDAIEATGLASVMIALSSFVAASVIEILRGTLSTYSAIELAHSLSPWSRGLLMLWGLAITMLLSCIIFLALLLHKK